jgi:glutathione S-transferase
MASYRYYRAFTPSPDEHVQKHFRRRLDDFLAILEQHLTAHAFAIGARPTIADISMMAYLHYPADETGYDFAASHPAIHAWLGRLAQLPGWQPAYQLLPGKRMKNYAK